MFKHNIQIRSFLTIALLASSTLFAKIDFGKEQTISFVGSGMGSRMIHYGHFETEIFLRFPHLNLTIR
ncbi:MAG: hypothetical protein ACKVJ1_12615, partial [Verrucomicrobiia bacterium]